MSLIHAAQELCRLLCILARIGGGEYYQCLHAHSWVTSVFTDL